MQAKVLGLNDIEDLNYLAEEVLMQLRFEGYRYDENGDEKAFAKSENGSHKERTKEMIEWIEMVEHNHPLSFRGNEELMKIPFTYALEISFDEIKEKYLKDYLPMMRGIMRKDTMLIGYMAGEEISDDYLDNLMALRYKENLKLWTMQWGKDNEFFFLIYGNPEFHDDDEYIGIYRSSAALLVGYKEALEEYRDSLPGGEKEFYRGSSLPPDDLIIYSYEKEKDGMRFVTVTPEQVWGEKTAKELRGKQI